MCAAIFTGNVSAPFLQQLKMKDYCMSYDTQMEKLKRKVFPTAPTSDQSLVIKKSPALSGQAVLDGSKNATLPILASLILTSGKSVLKNVPGSSDVHNMSELLSLLGAQVHFNQQENELVVDTSTLIHHCVTPEIMQKMRASVLVMGPLLARFNAAQIALPGGCAIGARPIDYHINNFKKMGVACETSGNLLKAHTDGLRACKIVLGYPSVGATENVLMAAVLTPGGTKIVNASLEPEVMDVIALLKKMGAKIDIQPPATIVIEGVTSLQPVEHMIIPDRLEAGGLLLAAAITGGQINLPDARADHMELFLTKLADMGHAIKIGKDGVGIKLTATDAPQAVSFVTAPFPGFPTDLQAPMMAALCLASGISVVHETVFENRLIHIEQLQKMGANITRKGDRAYITGVNKLYGTAVQATDIRASCALVLAGLVAHGTTQMSGLVHWRRGYQALEKKLAQLGAYINLETA